MCECFLRNMRDLKNLNFFYDYNFSNVRAKYTCFMSMFPFRHHFLVIPLFTALMQDFSRQSTLNSRIFYSITYLSRGKMAIYKTEWKN